MKEKEDVVNFFETLEEDDDVQNIYTQMFNFQNKLC